MNDGKAKNAKEKTELASSVVQFYENAIHFSILKSTTCTTELKPQCGKSAVLQTSEIKQVFMIALPLPLRGNPPCSVGPGTPLARTGSMPVSGQQDEWKKAEMRPKKIDGATAGLQTEPNRRPAHTNQWERDDMATVSMPENGTTGKGTTSTTGLGTKARCAARLTELISMRPVHAGFGTARRMGKRRRSYPKKSIGQRRESRRSPNAATNTPNDGGETTHPNRWGRDDTPQPEGGVRLLRGNTPCRNGSPPPAKKTPLLGQTYLP